MYIVDGFVKFLCYFDEGDVEVFNGMINIFYGSVDEF